MSDTVHKVGEPTSREVLIALNAHIDACTFMNKLTLGFMAAVLTCLITFTGYSYVNGQTLAAQLTMAREQQATAVANIPDKTADAVRAKMTGSN
jgi:hypothetical protein